MGVLPHSPYASLTCLQVSRKEEKPKHGLSFAVRGSYLVLNVRIHIVKLRRRSPSLQHTVKRLVLHRFHRRLPARNETAETAREGGIRMD